MRGDKRCHFSLFSGTSALSLALFQQADLTAVSGGHRRDSGSGKGKRRRAEERRIPARACTVPHGLRNRQQISNFLELGEDGTINMKPSEQNYPAPRARNKTTQTLWVDPGHSHHTLLISHAQLSPFPPTWRLHKRLQLNS
ncbi:hypothetical protein Y1Q_0004300 [Alligator mississippiensis]|uniref:Uncharacterized protein n=1 Tax=Alligator mississippiensis TaxID=8496 RepID=A0A151MIA1_ALLMI|nr:hypothetical protein Y1Q_0004300 [Alligator mississippiensis]